MNLVCLHTIHFYLHITDKSIKKERGTSWKSDFLPVTINEGGHFPITVICGEHKSGKTKSARATLQLSIFHQHGSSLSHACVQGPPFHPSWITLKTHSS